jgi:hypothetical protein
MALHFETSRLPEAKRVFLMKWKWHLQEIAFLENYNTDIET